ncbi:hypothetical protein Saso_17000 [Streptomyces asoensis]|uniref:Uncharacterized protein n=1 Tax=Streptomyces asoensis TaxID=249586 RepID=A0ABQ3RW06_9ACTN|nr:hypothetical protein GCM10010496_35970 [Streptomyces asoensis]GHI60050.1 hypothetical protein Saso_17000 [Streptomyces asoensis]
MIPRPSRWRAGGEGTGDQAAETGADHPAQAEGRVEGGHDRSAQRRDQVDRGAVEGHVDPAVGRAEEQQDDAERGGGVGERGKRDAQGEQDGADDGDRVAAVPVAQAPGAHHRDHRAGGDAEEGETEGAGGGAGLLLDRGDPDDPAGEDEAVEGEERGQGDTEPGEAAALARHRVMSPRFVHLRHKMRLGVVRTGDKGSPGGVRTEANEVNEE